MEEPLKIFSNSFLNRLKIVNPLQIDIPTFVDSGTVFEVCVRPNGFPLVLHEDWVGLYPAGDFTIYSSFATIGKSLIQLINRAIGYCD